MALAQPTWHRRDPGCPSDQLTAAQGVRERAGRCPCAGEELPLGSSELRSLRAPVEEDKTGWGHSWQDRCAPGGLTSASVFQTHSC